MVADFSQKEPWESHTLVAFCWINALALIQGGEGQRGQLEARYGTNFCESCPYSLRQESENILHLATPQRVVWEGHKEKVKPMSNYT